MKKLKLFGLLFLSFLFVYIIASSNLVFTTTSSTIYTFSNKNWSSSNGKWTATKDASNYDGSDHRKLQFTNGFEGEATSPDSFVNIVKIHVSFSRTSSGKGTYEVIIVDDEVETSVGIVTINSQTDSTKHTETITLGEAKSGEVKLKVKCTAKSIYLPCVEVEYSNATAFDVKFYDASQLLFSQVVFEGNKIIKPVNNPVNENHIFVGWYADSELKHPFDFNTTVSGNVNLYAKFHEGKIDYKGASEVINTYQGSDFSKHGYDPGVVKQTISDESNSSKPQLSYHKIYTTDGKIQINDPDSGIWNNKKVENLSLIRLTMTTYRDQYTVFFSNTAFDSEDVKLSNLNSLRADVNVVEGVKSANDSTVIEFSLPNTTLDVGYFVIVKIEGGNTHINIDVETASPIKAIFAQSSTTLIDGKGNVRFVGTTQDLQQEFGFRIAILNNQNQEIAHVIVNPSTLYTAITASVEGVNQRVSAEELGYNYIFAYTIKGVPVGTKFSVSVFTVSESVNCYTLPRIFTLSSDGSLV